MYYIAYLLFNNNDSNSKFVVFELLYIKKTIVIFFIIMCSKFHKCIFKLYISDIDASVYT